MTKKEAVSNFRLHILPTLPLKDKPARFEAWGIFTDSLCKDGQITMRQYENWVSPFSA